MDALRLGPFVISTERFVALLSLGLFVLVAELLARRLRDESAASLSNWASNTVWAVLTGSRLAFVLTHLNVYLEHPLTVFYFWQGGFAPVWGVAAGALYSLWYLRKRDDVKLNGVKLNRVVLPALVGVTVWAAGSVYTSGALATAEAAVLPELTLESLYTPAIELSSFAGQPAVVNVWATWCGPCARELPMFAEVAETSEVPFLFVDQLESRRTVATYLEQRALQPQYVLLDTQGKVGDIFRVKGTPTTLFFNSDGALQKRHVGEMSRAALGDYLGELQ